MATQLVTFCALRVLVLCKGHEVYISLNIMAYSSGDAELNQPDIKELKSLCKKGLVPMPDVFSLVLKHLQTEHCQVRISSFQVAVE